MFRSRPNSANVCTFWATPRKARSGHRNNYHNRGAFCSAARANIPGVSSWPAQCTWAASSGHLATKISASLNAALSVGVSNVEQSCSTRAHTRRQNMSEYSKRATRRKECSGTGKAGKGERERQRERATSPKTRASLRRRARTGIKIK